MPERKPWLLRDRANLPYPIRAPAASHDFDRALALLAAPVAARLAPERYQLARRVRLVAANSRDLAGSSDTALWEAADSLRGRLRSEGLTRALVARSFGLVCESTSRHMGIDFHPVQIMGGWALIAGMLAEMATGEGKTVTAALAATTLALAGMPVHVITVNDYLAARDAEQLGSVYRALGLSIGCVQEGQDESERRKAYEADITYVTGKEVAFDYLRDRLTLEQWPGFGSRAVDQLFDVPSAQLRLRGLGFAIVDEADSVLIDEARTPLIIADRDDPKEEWDYKAALEIAETLSADEHYRLREGRAAILTDAGRAQLRERTGHLEGLWRFRRAREEITEQALSALHTYRRDREYILRDDEVEIVDEYTGRVAEGRRWERGLHQLIEAKEGVAPTPRDRTAARTTYQSFFRRYLHLSGLTGTAAEHMSEFWAIYGLGVVRIPTHRPVLRRCMGRTLHVEESSRWDAVADAATRRAKAGRPVLIGTRSVAASEEISRRLTARGRPHTVLNARQDRNEAEIVARAGQTGEITVATNMAGRGTDIRLGPDVTANGGLHVIITEYHESPRIDRQLIGRAARQGDPGSWEAIVSLDDSLFVVHAPQMARLIRVLRLSGWRPATSLLRLVSQHAAESKHARDRRTVLRVERQTARILAFAGQHH
jgi:preprotein translocase subunit SecA